jgi:hypothetical protein
LRDHHGSRCVIHSCVMSPGDANPYTLSHRFRICTAMMQQSSAFLPRVLVARCDRQDPAPDPG